MNRLPHLAALTLVLSLGLVACGEDKKDAPDPAKVVKEGFRGIEFDAAVKAAKSENKVVMIDFTATWCGPCKKLDAETFANDNVKKFLKDRTVAIKVDVDKNKELAKKYEIRAIPQIVFIDGEGKEVGRFLGFRDAEKFLAEAEKHIKK